MKKLISLLLLFIFFILLVLFTQYKKPSFTKKISDIDYIIVEKAKRKMTVYNQGKVIKTYKISLGSNSIGHKEQEGDNKTPEGKYFIESKNPRSLYHLSLKISYPNQNDLNNAKAKGLSPGNFIMLHGIGNIKYYFIIKPFHPIMDWTQGCIAVTNEEIEEVYNSTSVGTAIEINP